MIQFYADVLSYCHSSRILDDLAPDGKPVFSAQDPDENRVHLKSRIHLTKKTYVFGMYLGKDGKRHMGFDVAVREDERGQHVFVEKFDPGLGIRCFGFTIWFRKPHKLDHED
jgi:hypothetical protein